MSAHAGKGKVFFYQGCDESDHRRCSYDINAINHMFETGCAIGGSALKENEYFLERMVSLMEGLQSENQKMYEQYENATKEYPELYQILVEGLSDKTLKIISDIDVSIGVGFEPADLGNCFVDKLLEDRNAPAARNVNAYDGAEALHLEM